jgi:hypothetical protein
VSLFADSSFTVFSDFEFVLYMYSTILNEWISFLVKKNRYTKTLYQIKRKK